MRWLSRSRTSAPTPASRSPSDRHAAPCSSRPPTREWPAASTRRPASSRPSAATAARKGDAADEITVETYLHVREDALQLYGFADRSERELFVQLLAVSGIGPKVALAIVSGSPVAELRRAIVRGDSARFQAIPGIGKKTAERIVLELKEKLGDPDLVSVTDGSGEHHVVARDALVELGWSLLDAERALAEVDSGLPPEERV